MLLFGSIMGCISILSLTLLVGIRIGRHLQFKEGIPSSSQNSPKPTFLRKCGTCQHHHNKQRPGPCTGCFANENYANWIAKTSA